MYETLIRPHEVNQIPTPLFIDEVSEKLKKAEQKREEKRLRQIANARSNPNGKRKRGGAADGEINEVAEEMGNKRVKTDDEDEARSRIEVGSSEANCDLAEPVQGASLLDAFSSGSEVQSMDPHMSATKINLSKAMPEVRGHTSYLTFACLVPAMSVSSPKAIVNEVSACDVKAEQILLTGCTERIARIGDEVIKNEKRRWLWYCRRKGQRIIVLFCSGSSICILPFPFFLDLRCAFGSPRTQYSSRRWHGDGSAIPLSAFCIERRFFAFISGSFPC
jgi:hypothetical protein